MAFVTSANTLQEIKDAFDDNASYKVEGDIAKAKEFIVAAMVYLRRVVDLTTQGDTTVRDEPEKIQKMLESAEEWWTANDAAATSGRVGGQAKHLSFASGFRE